MDPRHEDVFDPFVCICMSDREMGDGLPYPAARCRSHFGFRDVITSTSYHPLVRCENSVPTP